MKPKRTDSGSGARAGVCARVRGRVRGRIQAVIAAAAYIINRAAYSRLTRRITCVISALLFSLFLIGLLPAAMHDPEPDTPGSATNVFSEPGTLELTVIYSERDTWGRSEAEHLAGLLSVNEGLIISVVPDVRASDFPTGKVTVSIGHTLFSADTYIESYLSLGSDGYSVTHRTDLNRGDIFEITAFTAEVARLGIEHFASRFRSSGSLWRATTDVCRTEKSTVGIPSEPVISLLIHAGNARAGILVLSSPDAGEYSLAAMSALLDAESPALVIFNGDLDCGVTDRATLHDAWSRISAQLAEKGVPFCYTFASGLSAAERTLQNEIISSMTGCLTLPSASGCVTGCVILVREDTGLPCGAAYIIDSGDTDLYGSACDMIENCSGMLDRAARDSLSGAVVTVCADLLPQLGTALTLESTPTGEYSDGLLINEPIRTMNVSGAGDVFDTSLASGVSFFVCGGAYTNTGAASLPLASIGIDKTASLALTGSIGFDSPGLGGRFELNNSLRGGVFMLLELRRAGYTSASLTYTYAADFGVNVRN